MIIPGQFGFNCPSGLVLYKIFVFYADQKSKMAATAGHRLTLDPMGKCSNAFFSETTNMIKAKLYMNVHWMVLGSNWPSGFGEARNVKSLQTTYAK
jgi:hypothetical protein